MTRMVNAGFAEAIAANMSKRRVSNDKALQTVGDAGIRGVEAAAHALSTTNR